MSQFEEELSATINKLLKRKALNQFSPTTNIINKNLAAIYKNLESASKPHQLGCEAAISLMLANVLIANGWKQTRSPITLTEASQVNWWTFHKGQTKLEIVAGDAYNGKDPDVIITDHSQFGYPATVINLGPEIFGFYENVIENEYQNCLPTKLFNCFMSAANSRRQQCFYELVRRNLINDGAVSYLLNFPTDPINDIHSKLERYHSIKQDVLCQIFDHEHDLMQDRVPFKNFTTTLEQAIIDSKVSVVIETQHMNDQGLFFTEKTFRALSMPRPFYLHTPGYTTGAVEHLRKIGFDVYDDIVDHSYELISCPTQRLLAILDQVEQFKKFEYTPEILIDFESRACYNLQLIKQLRASLPQKYQTVVSQLKALA
jgi:hypothetical protein